MTVDLILLENSISSVEKSTSISMVLMLYRGCSVWKKSERIGCSKCSTETVHIWPHVGTAKMC